MSARLLVLGHPKSAKTGSLASLANSGRTLRYLDFDNNIDPLRLFTEPQFRKTNIQRVACDDVYGTKVDSGSGGMQVDVFMKEFKSWPTMFAAMETWPVDGSDPTTWDNNNILIFDSLSAMAKSQWNGFLAFNRNKKKHIQLNYKTVQDSIWNFFELVKTNIKCPVVVLAHIQQSTADFHLDDDIEDGNLKEKILHKKLEEAQMSDPLFGPVTLGQAQTRTLPSVFSGVVLVKNDEFGRKIYTTPQQGYNLGVPAPGIAAELDVSDGMAKIFDAWAPKPKITKDKVNADIK